MRVFMILCLLFLAGAIDFRDHRVKLEPRNDGSLLEKVRSLSEDVSDSASKGIEYYLLNYGPLMRIISTDFMDTVGIARNLQMAIPVVLKMVVIGIYSVMQFDESMMGIQRTVQSSYNFLKSFDTPNLHMINEITDRVFNVLDEASG